MAQQRTDLAAEACELRGGALPGVRQETLTVEGFPITRVTVDSPEGAASLGRPEGVYLTLTLDGFLRREENSFPRAVRALAGLLAPLLPPEGDALVAGLGNRAVTPDTIGPLAADHTLVTRHLVRSMPDRFGGLRSVAALAPGVLAATGVESGTLIRAAAEALRPLLRQARLLTRKYHAVITNPPYMGGSGMNDKLSRFVKEHYPDSKSDLFATFIEQGLHLVQENGFTSMITMESWMFLSSFEKLRTSLLQETNIIAMVHMPYLGKGGTSLGINFGTAATVLRKGHTHGYIAAFDRISYYETDAEGVPFTFPVENEYFKHTNTDNFAKIPGAPVAYWVSKNFIDAFQNGKSIGCFSKVSEGIKTGNNDLYLRLWHEICANKFSFGRMEFTYKWYPHHKGGEFRKWYGNKDWIINWANNGEEIKQETNSGLQGQTLYFKEFISWSKISSKGNPMRYYNYGCLFDSGAPALANTQLMITLALFNGKVGHYYLSVLSPTINLQVGDVKAMPLLYTGNSDIDRLAIECINLSSDDWNSFETSWDFKKHPII